MPRPDLRVIDGGAGYLTLTRRLAYLGRQTCLVEVTANPLVRRWLPTACIVSQQPAVGAEVTLRVPLATAILEGLVKRAEVPLGGRRAHVLAAIRPGDRLTLPSTEGVPA